MSNTRNTGTGGTIGCGPKSTVGIVLFSIPSLIRR